MSLIIPRPSLEIAQLPGGIRKAKFLAYPKWRRDPVDGRIKIENDTNIITDGTGGWKCDENNFHVYFEPWGDSADFVTFRHDPIQDGPNDCADTPVALHRTLVGIRWVNDEGAKSIISTPQHVSADIGGNQIEWAGIFGSGIDLRYTVIEDRLIKEFVVNSPISCPAPIAAGTNPRIEVIIRLRSEGAIVWMDGQPWSGQKSKFDTVEMRDASKVIERFRLCRPVATDSAVGDSELFARGDIEVDRKGAFTEAVISFPASIFEDATYPVFLDPIETWGEGGSEAYSGIIDAETRDGSYAEYVYNSARIYLKVGSSNDWRWAGFLRVNVSAIPDTSAINAATMHYKHYYTTNVGTYIYHYECLRDFVDGQTTWNNYDKAGNGAWASAGGDSPNNDVLGTPTLNSGYLFRKWFSSGTTSGTAYDTADFSSHLESLISGGGNQLRFRLNEHYSNNTAIGFCSSNHGITTNRPYLEVDYTPPSSGNTYDGGAISGVL